MPEELYTRQQELNLYVPRELTVVGCGGIGSWIAIFSAMSGVQTLFLFDPDIMEESNRNRLPFCRSSINRPKVEVVADFIRGIRPGATVVPIKDKLEGALLDIQLTASTTFMDGTDSPKSQIMLYNASKDRGLTYIRAGYDGTHITITSVISGWIKGDSEEEQYQVNPSWVVPAVAAASLAVGKLMKFQNQEVGLDLAEIGVSAARRTSRRTARCAQRGTRRR